MNKKDRFESLRLMSIVFVGRHDYVILPEVVSQK